MVPSKLVPHGNQSEVDGVFLVLPDWAWRATSFLKQLPFLLLLYAEPPPALTAVSHSLWRNKLGEPPTETRQNRPWLRPKPFQIHDNHGSSSSLIYLQIIHVLGRPRAASVEETGRALKIIDSWKLTFQTRLNVITSPCFLFLSAVWILELECLGIATAGEWEDQRNSEIKQNVVLGLSIWCSDNALHHQKNALFSA